MDALSALYSHLKLGRDDVDIVAQYSWTVPIANGVRIYTLIQYQITKTAARREAVKQYSHVSSTKSYQADLGLFRRQFARIPKAETAIRAVRGPSYRALGAYHVMRVANALTSNYVLGFETKHPTIGYSDQKIDILAPNRIAVEGKAKGQFNMVDKATLCAVLEQADRRLIRSATYPPCSAVVIVFPEGLLASVRDVAKAMELKQRGRVVFCELQEARKVVERLAKK